MRLTSTLAVAAILGFAGAPFGAQAQTVATWQEVQVNPVRPGGGTLLYPGGEYSRSVPALLYPGERSGPIRLHLPEPHRRQVASAEPQPVAPPPRRSRPVSLKPVPAPKPAPAPKLAKAEPPPPPRSSAPPADGNPFGGATDLSNVFGNASGPKTASLAPPPQKTAPAGPSTGNESLTKRSVILFAKDAPDPAKNALGALKFLAGDLNAAMTSPGARVELEAFGGAKGDKGSDAHRLALKRALSIRQVLIEAGVSADRIDVHANGGVDDTGPTDRVDVYVKA